MPKITYAGAPPRRPKRLAEGKPKLKGGRPRRQRHSGNWVELVVRPWIPAALMGSAVSPTRYSAPLPVMFILRGITDDLTIAEEAYRYLAAQARKAGRPVQRDDLIERIAHWLDMDVSKLTNWLRRSKRVR
jgi:hypothetical protein